MNLEIQSWYGRLGNNIIQLCNVLLLAKKKRYNITFIPDHNMLNIKHIPKKWLIHSNYSFNKTVKGRFFKTSELHKILGTDTIKFTVFDYKCILKDVVYNILKPDVVPSNPLRSDTIVIHIRSGDCFKENKAKPHPDYIPLPLSYYVQCIKDCCEKNDITHIIVVTENDKINPVISGIEDYITSAYAHNITFTVQSSSVENDMKTILAAQNLILSIGYFSKVLGLLSCNLKQVWISDYLFEYSDFEQLDGIDANVYLIKEYTRIGEWLDTPEQRSMILSHDNIVARLKT